MFFRRAVGTYRKRATEVKAIQVMQFDARGVADWCGGNAVQDVRLNIVGIEIPTLNDRHRFVPVGDWVIQESPGVFYACNNETFERIYEPAPMPPRKA